MFGGKGGKYGEGGRGGKWEIFKIPQDLLDTDKSGSGNNVIYPA